MTEANPISELAKAMAKFRQQVKQPKLDESNPFFNSNYLTLTGLQNAIDEALKGTGLSYMQVVTTSGNGLPGVRTVVMHESGESFKTQPLILRPVKNDPQGMGSAITYAKRYQLAAIFGISGEKDDDGNAASVTSPQQGPQRAPRQPYQRQTRPQQRPNYPQNNGGF